MDTAIQHVGLSVAFSSLGGKTWFSSAIITVYLWLECHPVGSVDKLPLYVSSGCCVTQLNCFCSIVLSRTLNLLNNIPNTLSTTLLP